MISNLAVLETEDIGSNVEIAEFSIIRAGARIGNNVCIHPHVVINPGVVIGDGTEIFPGAYIGKPPKGAGATARPISYIPKVEIGEECSIGPNAVIFYDVIIGHHTLLGDGASLREQVRVGHHCLISRYVTINYNTTIGDHTRIMDMTHITGNCRIGSNVFISVLVSSTNDNVVVSRRYDEEQILGPQVDDDATIGAGACLLPGVRVGRGAFVGANAVVTKDVQPYDLVMGVPARVVRNLKADL
ncbi:MAG: DapH/DapD/GlmU-related protein [Chloroflexota bacterium]